MREEEDLDGECEADMQSDDDDEEDLGGFDVCGVEDGVSDMKAVSDHQLE